MTEVETRIDTEFQKFPLPNSDSSLSKWHLVTVFEDGLRNYLWILTRQVEPDKVNKELQGFIKFVDRSKYALRYGLERVRQKSSASSSVTYPNLSSESYERASDILRIGEEYLLACRAFSSYHAGNAEATRNLAGDIIVFTPDTLSNVYSAINIILEGKQDLESGTPMDALASVFLWQDRPEFHVQEIISTTSWHSGRAKYRFNPFICNRLLVSVPRPPTIVPPQWRFPWGTSADTHRVFEGLYVRCLYHLIAVHFGASHLKIRGGGVEDICPLLRKAELISDIGEVTGMKQEAVSVIVDALCYGTKTDTPDPALQPLVPVFEKFLLPPILILSSNFPRNFLSLHARVDSRSFDEQSHLFEAGMSNRIENILKRLFKYFRMHDFLPQRKNAGEVDVLVADESSKTIMVCELRWLLSPGDPREVNNRKKVCEEKVLQLRKKVLSAREVIPSILASLAVRASQADG